MGASLLPIEDLTDVDVGAWRELADSALEPNPFYDPDFAVPAASELAPGRVKLLVTRDSGEWTTCLPVTLSRGWHRFPLRGMVGWKNLYCFLGTPLARPGAADGAIRELLEAGAERSGAFLGLDLVGMDGPVGRALETAIKSLGLRPVELDRFERAALNRRDEPLELNLSRKHRHNFERLKRRMEEELGGPLTMRDRGGGPEAASEFVRVEASGWKGAAGTALETIGHGPLFEEICRRLAVREKVQFVSAEAGDTTVAMLCNLIAGDTAFTFKIASAEEYSRYSPGIQLQILYLEGFGGGTLDHADSCEGLGNKWVSRLWPDRRTLVTRALTAPTARGALARAPLKGLARIRRKDPQQ